MAGVIVELEGAVVQPAVSPVVGRMLPIASAVVAAVTLYAVAGMHAAPARSPSSDRSSVLEEAFARQRAAPHKLELRLPQDVAAEILSRDVDGVTGLARPAPTIRSFRLHGTNIVVIVARILGAPAIVAPAHPPIDAVVVHGTYAVNYSVESMSLTAVRWTENGMTYEVSSRSLLLAELVAVADQVR